MTRRLEAFQSQARNLRPHTGRLTVASLMLPSNCAVIGVYKLTCLENDMVYVGSSVDCYNRVGGHLSILRKGGHVNKRMQKEFALYGEVGFEIAMADICATAEIAKLREAELIRKYKELGKSYNSVVPPLQILACRVDRSYEAVRNAWAQCESMLEWRNEREFVALIEQFLTASGMSWTAFGRTICSDPRFFFEIKKGRGCTLRRAEQVDAFIEGKLEEFKASQHERAAA